MEMIHISGSVCARGLQLCCFFVLGPGTQIFKNIFALWLRETLFKSLDTRPCEYKGLGVDYTPSHHVYIENTGWYYDRCACFYGQPLYILHCDFHITSIVKIPMINPPPTATTRVQNYSKCWETCQGISSALKSQTLPNLTCSKYIYRSKWTDLFWLVKALSGIVQGGQNDNKNHSKMPLCAHLGQQSKQAVDWFWPL